MPHGAAPGGAVETKSGVLAQISAAAPTERFEGNPKSDVPGQVAAMARASPRALPCHYRCACAVPPSARHVLHPVSGGAAPTRVYSSSLRVEDPPEIRVVPDIPPDPLLTMLKKWSQVADSRWGRSIGHSRRRKAASASPAGDGFRPKQAATAGFWSASTRDEAILTPAGWRRHSGRLQGRTGERRMP